MPSLASTEPLYERSSPTITFSFEISSPNHFGKSATIACRDANSGLSSKSLGSMKSRLAKGSSRRITTPQRSTECTARQLYFSKSTLSTTTAKSKMPLSSFSRARSLRCTSKESSRSAIPRRRWQFHPPPRLPSAT